VIDREPHSHVSCSLQRFSPFNAHAPEPLASRLWISVDGEASRSRAAPELVHGFPRPDRSQAAGTSFQYWQPSAA
jgi:hypothetical protein